MNDLITILMPMKNAELFVSDSIKSILSQTHRNLELIIVNDKSNDKSQLIVESFTDSRIKIIQGLGKGISAALNLALGHAKGKFICRCDADDLFPEDRLQTQLQWLNLHTDHIAVSGKFSSMDHNGIFISTFNTGDIECSITEELLSGVTRTHLGTFMIKRSIINKINGFRDFFITAEDIDMQLRIAECGPIGYMSDNMYFYRLHDNSITHVQSSNKREFFENLARELLKQRIEKGEDQLQKGIFPIPPKMDNDPINTEQQVLSYMLSESWRLHTQGEKKLAVNMALRICSRKPLSWHSWTNLLLILIK